MRDLSLTNEIDFELACGAAFSFQLMCGAGPCDLGWIWLTSPPLLLLLLIQQQRHKVREVTADGAQHHY